MAVVAGTVLVVIVLAIFFPDSVFGTIDPYGVPARFTSLREGDCFDHTTPEKPVLEELGPSESTVTLQPCTSPHDAEIFGKAPLTLNEGLPGDPTLPDEAEENCRQLLRPSDLRNAPEGIRTATYYPNFPGLYERTAICVFEKPSERQLTAPIRPVA